MSKQPEEVIAEERVERWGFDPFARLQYIGVTERSFSYFHPTLLGATGRFEFYYNLKTGDIDVHHRGCNGRIFTGKELPDGTVTFSCIPRGYPGVEIFVNEFKALRDNIGAWERAVAKQYNLHDSWLEPFGRFSNGSKCCCCNKMRADSHYITDTVLCVFCSVACRNKEECQS